MQKLIADATAEVARQLGASMSEQHEEMHRALTGRPNTAPRDQPRPESILNSSRPGAFQDDSLDDNPAAVYRREYESLLLEQAARADWPIPMPALTLSTTEMQRLREENEHLRERLVRAASMAPAPVYLLPMRAGDPLLLDDVTTATQSHPSPTVVNQKPLPSRKIVTD